MDNYHNTTQETGSELGGYQVQAESQDNAILTFMKERPNQWFTAEHIQAVVLPDAPLTSVRRAISNLRKHLTRGNKVKGQYGRPIYEWAYTQEEPF